MAIASKLHYTHIHTRSHIHTRTHAHTRTHTHARTHIHTHADPHVPLLLAGSRAREEEG